MQPRKDLLQLNGRLDIVHPLHSKLALLVTIISGQPSKVQAYQQWLQPSFVMPLREGTKQQYDSTLRRWGEFCRPLEIHPITPPINDVVEFLSYLYDNGGRFGVIATARSTLGNFIHVPGVPVLANHPIIQKVVKGAYNTRPPAPLMFWSGIQTFCCSILIPWTIPVSILNCCPVKLLSC